MAVVVTSASSAAGVGGPVGGGQGPPSPTPGWKGHLLASSPHPVVVGVVVGGGVGHGVRQGGVAVVAAVAVVVVQGAAPAHRSRIAEIDAWPPGVIIGGAQHIIAQQHPTVVVAAVAAVVVAADNAVAVHLLLNFDPRDVYIRCRTRKVIRTAADTPTGCPLVAGGGPGGALTR